MSSNNKKRKAGGPKNPDWIDWRNSKAKKVIMEDLIEGRLPLQESEMSTWEAWLVYANTEEFKEAKPVVFSQFKERLKDHRKQVMKLKSNSDRDCMALANDRLLYPRKTHNQRGEPVFDLSPAKLLLRADVAAKRHEGIGPREFQQTRPEYMEFMGRKIEPAIFRRRIKQEEKRQKWINHLIVKGEAKRHYNQQTRQLLHDDVAAKPLKVIMSLVAKPSTMNELAEKSQMLQELYSSHPEYSYLMLHEFKEVVKKEARARLMKELIPQVAQNTVF